MSDVIQQIAESTGGKVEEVGYLPDGSGFAVMSLPLPKTHWLYVTTEDGYTPPPPMGLLSGADHPARQLLAPLVREAVKYGYKAASANGKEADIDPDALLQNTLVGLFGYHTDTGLTSDTWANPETPGSLNAVLLSALRQAVVTGHLTKDQVFDALRNV